MARIENMKISITTNGPYLVEGSIPLAKQTIVADAEGNSIGWSQGEEFDAPAVCALCRCGQSTNKPFCDGSHVRTGFDGTETARREPYTSQATEQVGPSLILADAPPLCAFARYCDVAGQVWNLVEESGTDAAKPPSRQARVHPVAWSRGTRRRGRPSSPPSNPRSG